MARKTVVELVDDLDGGPADETVRFALDGVDYSIDLSATHADRLRAAVAEFVGHARRAGSRPRREPAADRSRSLRPAEQASRPTAGSAQPADPIEVPVRSEEEFPVSLSVPTGPSEALTITFQEA